MIIGNPGVADVTIQDPQTLVLTGKSYGQTNLIVLDSQGNPIADTMIEVVQAQADLVTVYLGNVADDARLLAGLPADHHAGRRSGLLVRLRVASSQHRRGRGAVAIYRAVNRCRRGTATNPRFALTIDLGFGT